MTSAPLVRQDFDRIATLGDGGWSHNRSFHRWLLARLPANPAHVLEVGCGGGEFTALLAAHSRSVLAIDLSPGMLVAAQLRVGHLQHVTLRCADVTRELLPPESFDAVVSIATLHHVPYAETLHRLSHSLRPGGRLLVLDLHAGGGPLALGLSLLSRPLALVLRRLHTGRFTVPSAEQAAWAEHARHDQFMKWRQIRTVVGGLLPGARLRRHLLWRYSLVWERGADYAG